MMDIPPDQNDKYINDYWNTISRAVGQILHNSPGVRVSFEQMYSIVYKCVCDGFAEKMHSDLLAQCSHHLEEVDRSLDACDPRIPQQYGEESLRLVIAFHEALELYLIAVQQITPIFAYMNKFYVEALLQTSLQVELMDLFRQKVADRRMDRIMASSGPASDLTTEVLSQRQGLHQDIQVQPTLDTWSHLQIVGSSSLRDTDYGETYLPPSRPDTSALPPMSSY
ncbi:CDK2-associated and cullin domain-containing protein 1 isoform X3 [Anabrus simplex]|uniref:CDK2-associated and cullin domain-containing protein 1 isoform X3 n=1 Tax=Anabrus simplex TaxID=316456 RepID=UPI0035A2A012